MRLGVETMRNKVAESRLTASMTVALMLLPQSLSSSHPLPLQIKHESSQCTGNPSGTVTAIITGASGKTTQAAAGKIYNVAASQAFKKFINLTH